MPALAFVGTGLSHGGHVVTGSPTVTINNLPLARVGDLATCTIHGSVIIISGSSSSNVGGHQIARLGDICSCGAILVAPGSTNATCG